VDAVLERVLSKDPSQRYNSCRNFIDALYEALQRSIEKPKEAPKAASPPPPPAPPPPRPDPRPKPPPSGTVFTQAHPHGRWKLSRLVATGVTPGLGLMGWMGWKAWSFLGQQTGAGMNSAQTIHLESVPAPYISEMPPAVEREPNPELPAEPGTVIG